MRLRKFIVLTIIAIAALAGCKKQQSDTDAIRAGIVAHLTALNTLNLGAMDIHVTSVNIQGNQAQAQVEFLPKTGAPSGAGMQVSYALERENGNWIVQKTLATGGMIEHPAAGANSHVPEGQIGVTDITAPPQFRDLVHRDALKSPGSLPPGHPQAAPISPHSPATNTQP